MAYRERAYLRALPAFSAAYGAYEAARDRSQEAAHIHFYLVYRWDALLLVLVATQLFYSLVSRCTLTGALHLLRC